MAAWLRAVANAIGRRVAAYLGAPRPHGQMMATVPAHELAATLRVGDVLLVEGGSRVSRIIKYLTQSNWSHATLYVGCDQAGCRGPTLIEADLEDGVRATPLTAYTHMHTRICRPQGLAPAEIDRLVAHVLGRVGEHYDLQNLVDLGRYLMPVFPIPQHRRRQMLAFGSGDPTRAICSTLIAQAFQAIRYPILPELRPDERSGAAGRHYQRELLHIRHYSLFVPRDFDMSPYFEIVKPTLQSGFDPHRLQWAETPEAASAVSDDPASIIVERRIEPAGD
ncbi:MAG TPA: YiiX/YebB-like N1pC/P60 family cysteine hydrolase [Rubrivivax sp.]|nr:lipo-like protein [Burkholderiales bacterium]HNU10115.1 YiiX/YebB-like N1pC/P60 family cysteine hydrolase [Rubrivivax sp.]